jgi:putative PIN family toxin of toxin-antitoxin system
MARAVLDTTVLVSALLKPIAGGACYDLIQLAEDEAFELFLSPDILEETVRVLLTRVRIRRRYAYSDDDVAAFCWRLTDIAMIIRAAPAVQVARDPNDDMILACAIAASADYLITRDKDLLILDKHEGIAILTPEAFLQVLRIGD